MAIKTNHLRHVVVDVRDGNGTFKALIVQQWYKAEGWEHEKIIRNGGFWEELEISNSSGPYDLPPPEERV